MVGITSKGIMSAKGHFTEQTKMLLELAKGPAGVTVDDLPPGVHQRALWRISERGRLFTIKSGTRAFKRHYFDTQERADAYYKANPNPVWVSPAKAIKAKKQQEYKAGKPITIVRASVNKPQAGGPARQPGEPIITASTRITIAPPPPDRLYRTNTFSVLP
jgi:hypothetical protein